MAMFTVAFVGYSMLVRRPFEVLFVIEPGVCRILNRLRRLIPGAPRLVYTHGISDGPQYYFGLADEVIEVNGPNFDRATEYGHSETPSPTLHLIPHFVRQIRPTAITSRKQDSRRALGIRQERVLAHVGVISRDPKRVDYIIDEAASLAAEWHLLLIGDVVEQDLLDRARDLMPGRVTQVSLPREAVGEALRAADFSVLASYNEGFGLVTLEALNESVPVLLPDTPLFRWILKDAGRYLDMRRPGELARAIIEAWPQREKILAECRNVLFHEYTWPAVRERYGKILTNGNRRRT